MILFFLSPCPCLFFTYPYDRLWFIDGREFWQGDVDPEVQSRAQEESCLIVPWTFVAVFVIPPSPGKEVFLSPSMVEIDAHEWPRWHLVAGMPGLANYSDLSFYLFAAPFLAVPIAQVRFAGMTAL